ncbi:MAG: hypothetical protein ACYC9L_11005 [Sulfuricaulis sp.]
MISTRARLSSFSLAIGFFSLCIVYYYWGWSRILGNFGGDNAYYLLIARHFSPWNSHSNVAAYFATHSQYPPLYPLVLAIFGGDKSLLVAHLVTVTCLLFAFVAAYIWLRTLNVSKLVSSLLILLIALLPETYMQALEVLSENLFLLLTLSCMGAVVAYENDRRSLWLWLAVCCLVAAMLTRSAGVSLLAAFILYLLLYRPPNYLRFAIASVLPMIAWNIFSTNEGQSYLNSFVEKYKPDSATIFLQSLANEGRVLWYAWTSNIAGSNTAKPLTGFLGALCLIGMGHRVYLRKLDGFYAAAYLAMILIWPYPAEAKRFLFVVMPVLLVQAILLLEWLPKMRIATLDIKPIFILFVAVILIVIPDLALTIERFMVPLPAEYADYRRLPGWYAVDPNEARISVTMSKLLTMHLRGLSAIVPENDCIYSIKPSIVGYYSDRIGLNPPMPYFDQAAFNAYLKENNCHYFYLMGFASPSFPEAYYPLERLHESLKIISLAQAQHPHASPVGMLAEFKRP